MFKTFIFGIILGAAASAAALYFLPPVNQVRELSVISVMPNGGNSEVFHANIPTDRILLGAAGRDAPIPAGLDWPDDELFAGAQAELFKIRNVKDAVVGVASRLAANDTDGGVVEWVLHLPARGSTYLLMDPEARNAGYRVGTIQSGTREFGDLIGAATERWISDTTSVGGAPAGKIELRIDFVAAAEEL